MIEDTSRLDQIDDKIYNADFSTRDGIIAIEDWARANVTAKELAFLAERGGFFLTRKDDEWCMKHLRWLYEEAKKLIVAIRSVGGGGIERTVLADGRIDPYLDFEYDIETGKQIDELYDQTILNLRRIAARAMKNNATIQGIAAKQDEIGKNIDTLQDTVNDGFDDITDLIDAKENLPIPYLIGIRDEDFKKRLFDVCKRETNARNKDRKRKLENVLNNATLTYRGWTINEMCRGKVEELQKFMNRYRMSLKRHS